MGEAGGAVVDAQQLQRGVGVGSVPAAQEEGGVVAEGGPRVPEAQRSGPHTVGVERGVGGCDGGLGPGPEGQAGVGEVQVMGGAVHQPDAQVLFEPAQRPGDGRLAGVQAVGGTRDAALLRDGEEGPQMPQLHGHVCEA